MNKTSSIYKHIPQGRNAKNNCVKSFKNSIFRFVRAIRYHFYAYQIFDVMNKMTLEFIFKYLVVIITRDKYSFIFTVTKNKV